jgi:hypothetical protein
VLRYEHETETLRQQLQQREQERERNRNLMQQREEVFVMLLLLILVFLSISCFQSTPLSSGSDFSPSRIPNPNCLHPGSSSKNLSILTPKKAKKWFLSSKKYDPGCSSRIRMLTFSHHDPGSRGQKSTQSRIRIRNTAPHTLFWPCAAGKRGKFGKDMTLGKWEGVWCYQIVLKFITHKSQIIEDEVHSNVST